MSTTQSITADANDLLRQAARVQVELSATRPDLFGEPARIADALHVAALTTMDSAERTLSLIRAGSPGADQAAVKLLTVTEGCWDDCVALGQVLMDAVLDAAGGADFGPEA